MTPPTDLPPAPAAGSPADPAAEGDGAEDHVPEVLPGLDLHRFRCTGRPAAEDPRAARMVSAVERGFYEEVPTGAALDQVLALHGQDARTYVGIYAAGADPQATDPVGSFAGFAKPLHTGGGRELDAFLVSDVTVRPTHRRRGILRTMMRAELDRVAAAGTPIAALNASEATIYRRFGFGVATARRSVEVDTAGQVDLAGPVSGTMRMVDPKDLADLGPRLFAQAHRQSPGSVGRTAGYAVRETDTSQAANDGKGTGLLAAVHHDDDGTPRGYVTYRFAGWKKKTPTVTVDLLFATTAASQRALWGFLVNLDLIRRVRWRSAPDDRFLEHVLVDPRRVTTRGTEDHLWLRLLDVPACFHGRGYGRDGSLVLEVDDGLGHAAGTWRLDVAGGEADVVRVGGAGADAPDLSLDVAELSSVYLGGVSADMLRQAGRITEHRPGAAAELTALLAQGRTVHSLTSF
jgi:predicted acetyltransferase